MKSIHTHTYVMMSPKIGYQWLQPIEFLSFKLFLGYIYIHIYNQGWTVLLVCNIQLLCHIDNGVFYVGHFGNILMLLKSWVCLHAFTSFCVSMFTIVQLAQRRFFYIHHVQRIKIVLGLKNKNGSFRCISSFHLHRENAFLFKSFWAKLL